MNFIITFDDFTNLDPFALGLLCDGYDERRRGHFTEVTLKPTVTIAERSDPELAKKLHERQWVVRL